MKWNERKLKVGIRKQACEVESGEATIGRSDDQGEGGIASVFDDRERWKGGEVDNGNFKFEGGACGLRWQSGDAHDTPVMELYINN